MNKKLIRLTEQDLHRIVKESVYRILSEARKGDDEYVKGPDGYSHYYINHKDRTVSPIHGYYSSKAPKKYVERNGYRYIEPIYFYFRDAFQSKIMLKDSGFSRNHHIFTPLF